MTAPAYQSQRWFHLLMDAVGSRSQQTVATELGLSRPAISQIVRGTGLYGSGKASTDRIAQRVLDAYGQWICPFLSEDDAPREITSAQCRALAHRPTPTTSPRDLTHWRACQKCPMKHRSAPPQARPHKPRPRHDAQAHPEGEAL